MSWSLVGVSSTVADAVGDLTATLPASIASGDLLIAEIGYRGSAAFTVPTGGEWIQVEQDSNGNATAGGANTSDGGQLCGALMAYCIRGGSDPNLVFTRSTTNDDISVCVVSAYRWGGGAGTIALDDSSINQLGSGSTTPSTGAVTSANATALIVAMSVCGSSTAGAAGTNFDATDPGTDSGSNSVPDTSTAPTAGTWIARVRAVNTAGADVSMTAAEGVKSTAGSTGTISATSTFTRRYTMIAAAFSVAGGSDGNASGSLSTVTVSASGGSATGSASASGATGAAVTVTPMGCVASVSVDASGALGATVSVSALAGAATGAADVSGALGASVTVSALGGAAVGDGEASGSLSAVTISALAGSAAGDADATGSFSTVTVTAMSGSATGGTVVDGNASGAFGSDVTVSAVGATAAGEGFAAGSLSPVTLTPLGVVAIGHASAEGTLSAVTVTPMGGTASVSVQATGALAEVAVSAMDAAATGTAEAEYDFSNVIVFPMGGQATIEAATPESRTTHASARLGPTRSGRVGTTRANAEQTSHSGTRRRTTYAPTRLRA